MTGLYDGRNTFYVGEFDDDMEREMILPLYHVIKTQAALKEGDGFIDMFVNSYGGNADIAFTVVELMELAKSNGVMVRTIVTSAAYSGGSVIAVAGTPGERYIARDADHLVHYGSISNLQNSSPGQAVRTHNSVQGHFKQMLRHYNKHCDIKNLEENMIEDDWYINATLAKKWKMADKFIDKFEFRW